MLGLFLIALGTGGIKPCVAAFGGDQFEDHQVRRCSKIRVTYCREWNLPETPLFFQRVQEFYTFITDCI